MNSLKRIVELLFGKHEPTFDMEEHTNSENYQKNHLTYAISNPRKNRHAAFAWDKNGNLLARARSNNCGCAERQLFKIIEEEQIPLSNVAHVLVIQAKFKHSGEMESQSRRIFKWTQQKNFPYHKVLDTEPAIKKFLAKISRGGESRPCSDCGPLLIEKVPNATVTWSTKRNECGSDYIKTWSTRTGNFEQVKAVDLKKIRLHVRLKKQLRKRLNCKYNDSKKKRRKMEETIAV